MATGKRGRRVTSTLEFFEGHPLDKAFLDLLDGIPKHKKLRRAMFVRDLLLAGATFVRATVKGPEASAEPSEQGNGGLGRRVTSTMVFFKENPLDRIFLDLYDGTPNRNLRRPMLMRDLVIAGMMALQSLNDTDAIRDAVEKLGLIAEHQPVGPSEIAA